MVVFRILTKILIYSLLFSAFFSCEIHFNNPFLPPSKSAEIFSDSDNDNTSDNTETITRRTITIDGSGDDWEDVNTKIIDEEGDSNLTGSGTDITQLSLAADENNIYFLLETADKTLSTSGDFKYRIRIAHEKTMVHKSGYLYYSLYYSEEDAHWHGFVNRWNGETFNEISSYSSEWTEAGDVAEYKLPRSELPDTEQIAFMAVLFPNDGPPEHDYTEWRYFELPSDEESVSTTNSLTATGTIRGSSVSIDTNTADVSRYESKLRIEGTCSSPSGETLYIEFYTDSLSSDTTYGTPEIAGDGSVEMLVASSLIEEAEGYGGNYVVDPSTLTIEYIDSSRLKGTFDLTTNIGDTLEGVFDVKRP